MRFVTKAFTAAMMVIGFAFGCGSSDGPTNPSGGGGGGGGGGTNPPPASATVNATGSSTFSPAQVTIAPNGTVTWAFAAAITHNVTFGTTNAPANIPNTTDASVARTFPNTGTFNYSCTLHPGMSGSVTVQ
jgi:plastocyanin